MNILPQILVFSLVASGLYVLIAAGLTLTFGTLEFINFAHGDIAVTGAFIFFALYVWGGLPLWISLIIAILATALLGFFIEKTTFKPVRNKQAFIPLILSIGVSMILQAILLMIFGGGTRTYAVESPVYSFWNDRLVITLPQIAIILTALFVMTGLFLFFKYTKIGKAIRAVSDNKEIASTLGISVNKTLSITFALASGLAALGGILAAFDQNLLPTMGILFSIKVFAVIVFGGVGSLSGAVLGALIIGFSENFLVAYAGVPGSFKEAIVFFLLILALLFRPYGILGGKKEEVESR